MPRPKPAAAGPKQKTPPSKPARRRTAAVPRTAQPQWVPAREVLPLTPEACLLALSQLADRIERRMVTPSHAAALRGIYQVILEYHKKSDAPQKQTLSDALVRELLQCNRKILSQLEPQLTEDQLAMVMREVRDAPE